MSILNESEIDKLKDIHPKKKILRIIFLVIGISLIIAGVLLLILAFDFGVEVSDMNISFLLDILIIVFGMILTSKYFIAPYYLRENSLTLKKLRNYREPVTKYIKFNSFALSRLIAGSLLVIVGLFSYAVFGIEVGANETRYGNFFVLGGPSFFYATGLPVLIIGLFLLLYVLLSTFRGIFAQSDNFYFFRELRPLVPWLTEIPKKDIEAVRYQNNHLGPKLAWIILLIPFIVLQLMTAIPLFSNNERAGPEYVFSWTLATISVVEIAVLILLVTFQQNYYEIATKDMLYEMWFAPIKLRDQVELTEGIADFLGCGIEKQKREKVITILPKSVKETSPLNGPIFSELCNTNFQLLSIIFGIFLIVSAIVMLTQMVLFGPLFWWIALMYGFMLVIKAFNTDFSRKGGDLFTFDEQKKVFKFQRRFGLKFHYLTALKVDSLKVRKWFRRLDFFDIFGLGGMTVMLTVQQIEGWALADTSELMIINLISTIYMVVVFVFIILYLCAPIDTIEFKTPTITYRIPVTKKLNNSTLIKKYSQNLKTFLKDARDPELRKVFFKRIALFLILVLGTLTYTIINLITYFY